MVDDQGGRESVNVSYYYYYYAAFNTPCVGHKDDESHDSGTGSPG